MYFYDFNGGLNYRMTWNTNLRADTMVYAFLLIEQAELSLTDSTDKNPRDKGFRNQLVTLRRTGRPQHVRPG